MSYTYVDTPNANLICCICRAPFTEPYTTRTCCHTFCYECIVTAIGHYHQCPVDRSPLCLDDLTPASPVVRNLVDELIVECPRRSAGCTHKGQRQLMASHLQSSCQCIEAGHPETSNQPAGVHADSSRRNDGPSLESGCSREQDPESQGQLHVGGTTCGACSAEISPSELMAHESTCGDIVISCTHAPNGCTWTGPRRSFAASHIHSCPYESIKGFFAIQNDKLSALTQENLGLRHKLDALEGICNIMKRELAATKTALGPWYRLDGQRRLSTSSMTTPNLGPSSPVFDPPEFSLSDAPPHAAHSLTGQGSTSGTSADPSPLRPSSSLPTTNPNPPPDLTEITSYFPAIDDDDAFSPSDYLPSTSAPSSSSSSHIQQQPPTPSPSHHSHHHHHHHAHAHATPLPTRPAPYPHHPYPHQQHPHQPPPAIAQAPYPSAPYSTYTSTSASLSIAPLDLSTTLEGSLAGLRASVLTLAGALETLGRQHEVARTTEAMRMGEELRSVHAAVHGVRMQVHSIMVDRNAQATGRAGAGAGGGGSTSSSAMSDWAGGGEHREGPWLPFAPRYGHAHPAIPPVPASVPKL